MATIKLKYRPSTMAQKEGQLYFQVIHKRTVRQIGTEKSIMQTEWDEPKGEIRITDTPVPRQSILRHIAEEVQWQRDHLYTIIEKLDREKKDYTADDIVSTFESGYRSKEKVLVYISRQICLHHEAGRHTTAEHYDQTLRSFSAYREGYDLAFENVTPQMIISYETWLKSQHLCRNTTSFYMRNLRTMYNKAVEEGITTDKKPFQKVYTGIDKTTKRAITTKEIRLIKGAELTNKSRLDYARDMFLLSFYLRGIAPIDLAYLRKADIREGYIAYTRSKTGQQMRIRIEPVMQKLIDKYRDTGTQYLLPLIKKEDGTERIQYRNSAKQINRALKQLATKLGITFPLSLYVARHSWASIAHTNHEPLSVISAAMGHDSEVTTQIYLASIQTAKIDEANSKILRSL